MANELIVLVGDDGMPLPAAKPMAPDALARLDRAADLHWAYQLGEEAAQGDADACNAELLEVFPHDAEAHAEFVRGMQYVADRATKQ